jgi:hypothetical protein
LRLGYNRNLRALLPASTEHPSVHAEATIQQLKQQAGGVQAELQQERIGYDQASEELKAAAADRDESAANLAHQELQLQEQEVRC